MISVFNSIFQRYKILSDEVDAVTPNINFITLTFFDPADIIQMNYLKIHLLKIDYK